MTQDGDSGLRPPLGGSAAEYSDWERVDSCPVCDARQASVVDAEAAIVRCAGCGHRYVDPRPTQAEIARGYSLPTSYDDWVQVADARERMWRRRFDRVLGHRRSGRMLDVGAGIGTFLAIAREHGWAVDGTEVSSTAVAKARDLHGIEMSLGFAEEAGLDGPYDVICLWHVLEHLPSPAATLRYCRTLMAPGAQLILAMPNDGTAVWAPTVATNVLRRARGRPPTRRYALLRPGVESHIQHFSPATIRSLLGRTGFVVDLITVDDAAPVRSRLGSAAYSARRLLTRITPWNLGREMLVVARPRT